MPRKALKPDNVMKTQKIRPPDMVFKFISEVKPAATPEIRPISR